MGLAIVRRRLIAALALMMVLTTVVWQMPASVAAMGVGGAVYVATNQVAGNEIAIFTRAWDGRLTPAGMAPTGGLGTGGGLGSQGSLIVSQNKRWLFVVNAGSNSISVFAMTPSGLSLTDTVPSGGLLPVSLTNYQNLLYVLNTGGSGTITGFRLSPQGKLTPLANSTRPLSSTAARAAQVEFSPNGHVLAVTERATNIIDTYVVGADGLATGPQAHPSSGMVPFGFAFTRGNRLIVSEAAQGAVSSYQVSPSGAVNVISASVTTFQNAACWVVVTGNGRFAYTSNAASGSITGYRVGADGSLTRLDADGITGVTGPGTSPIDMSIDRYSKYLSVLETNAHKIGVFEIYNDGSLRLVEMNVDLPVGAAGIAAN